VDSVLKQFKREKREEENLSFSYVERKEWTRNSKTTMTRKPFETTEDRSN